MTGTERSELATPVWSAEWYEKDNRVVVVRPRVGRSWLSPSRWFAAVFEPRRWRLDELGSFCWRRLDGERTVGELADELRAEYGETVEPAEERVGRFLHVLVREGMARPPGSERDRITPGDTRRS